MQFKISTSLVLLSLIASNEALRFLVCFPMVSKSHSILGHGVTNRLLDAGHEVVHITAFPRDKLTANLTEINVVSIADFFMKNSDAAEKLKLKNLIGQGNVSDTLIFTYINHVLHKNFLNHPRIVKLLSDPNEKFDAVIIEWFFTELNAGIAPLFQCPLIWVCSTEPHWQALRIMDEVPNPAYTVDLFATYRPPLDFFQRAYGLWKIVYKSFILDVIVAQFEKWVYYSVYPEIAAKRGVTMPSYDEAIYNGSLMFINSHPSVGGSLKLPQNAINIAGYHIDDNVKPLPEDLQTLMDEAKHGVIYFSMGSNLLSNGMSEEMQRSLLDMFSKYKQTVIWKFESDMDNVPANVRLVKWAPQPSILAHPNLKLFITHGGQLSTTEAMYFGVPLIGIPVMADQHVNMKSVEQKGFGIHVTLAETIFPELDAAVRKVLTDDTYKIKAKELSAIYHDREMPPGRSLVHWVEHVVRTKGAPHLKSPALHVPLYQRLYLDLIAVLTIILLLFHKLLKYLLSRKLKNANKSKKVKSS